MLSRELLQHHEGVMTIEITFYKYSVRIIDEN